MVWSFPFLIIFLGLIFEVLIKHGPTRFIIFLFIPLTFFVGIPVLLHFNFWDFDKDTVLIISSSDIKLINKSTGKEFKTSFENIKEIIYVRPSLAAKSPPWGHEYVRVKLKQGGVFTLSNYVIDPIDLVEILGIKVTVDKDIFIPKINRLGTIDIELRS